MGAGAPTTAKETSPKKNWPFLSQWKELFHAKEAKDFWAGMQSIFLIIGIIVGGVWTGLTFSKLGSVNRARAEIESLEAQNARAKDQQSDVEMSIEATQLKPPANDRIHYLTVTVTVKNIGTRNLVMCFEDPFENLPTNCPSKTDKEDQPRTRRAVPPVTVTHATSNPDATQIIFDTPISAQFWREDNPKKQLKGLELKVGQTEYLATLVPLKEVGLYRVAFAVPQADEDTMVAPRLRPIWSISRFFVVRDNSELALSKRERD